MITSYVPRICARRRVCPQIRAYFSGYIRKLGGKNKKRLRFESCLYCFHLVSIKHRLFGRGAAYSDDINPRRFSTADVFIVYMLLRCPIKQRNRLHRVCVQAVSPFLYYNRVWVSYNPHPHCSVNQCHVFLLIGHTSILSRAPLSCAPCVIICQRILPAPFLRLLRPVVSRTLRWRDNARPCRAGE